ncbi:unnamed protein product [Kuraishia capsulata CBS 1993]|uniref:1,3-beta-glucan synthase n=1 Tax=Kuraishia capsulata CBS 1993 TaxID=1382522 RepID=W6MQF9_9ASCO|nr:uncharacterized protein KUCA_T00004526001 [Kuraishia capsulata CBS 1993]CDK28543.1 unnamed protein product [Kuraishia capsulata CBS 1993]
MSDDLVYNARLGEALLRNDGVVVEETVSDQISDQISEIDSKKPSEFSGSPVVLDEDPYLAWNSDSKTPISAEQIWEIFEKLKDMFGFQRDSVLNMYDHLMVQLDSRASRMTSARSLLSLHADYIGGEHSNYRKWYFASHLNQPGEIYTGKQPKDTSNGAVKDSIYDEFDTLTLKPLEMAEYKWKWKMGQYSPEDMIHHLALYLLIWGESNQVRFTPECLCFLFKCAWDHMDYIRFKETQGVETNYPEYDFLNRYVTPLYNFIRDQQLKFKQGRWVRREKDHDRTIGYDDVNQLFWHSKGISRLVLDDGSKLLSYDPHLRYSKLAFVRWDKAFYKTYKERRSSWHLATNFSRIWIIHISVFWYYYCFNSPTFYTKDYSLRSNSQPTPQAQLSACSLAGALACIIQLTATVSEWAFVPRQWPDANHVFLRIIAILFILALNVGPSVYIFGFNKLDAQTQVGFTISVAQFVFSIITTLYFSFQTPQNLFSPFRRRGSLQNATHDAFSASFPKLTNKSRILSCGLWLTVFGAKFLESYIFLTLSLRDSIISLSLMDMNRCTGEAFWGNIFCRQQARVVLVLMYGTDFILFFLDTYLWYIICNCALSVALAFSSGISVMSPWKNVISRLPQRIYSKLLRTHDKDYRPNLLIFQIWNAIMHSMHRDHLISREHLARLLFTQTTNEQGEIEVKVPSFFVSQGDTSKTFNYFFANSEGERRISFFAQSLSTPIPEPGPINEMPTFTVLIPHYEEKVILSLKEIIREDENSRISLLEYLKELYKSDWDCFVEDSKFVATAAPVDKDLDEACNNDDLPFYCVGYKSSSSEFTLRTRIWASLRTQTLYRTISGFMNYYIAIKLLCGVENSEIYRNTDDSKLKPYLEAFVKRKFRLVVSMQKYQKMTKLEKDDIRHLAQAFPHLNIVSLEQEKKGDGEEITYFSTLYGCSETDADGMPKMIYKVQLSGNPILGDGKADNQNMSLIYYRGEYIQVIDANQDNYLEECLKVRSVLSEFEGKAKSFVHPYALGCFWESEPPVAIVGAREYIFSENTGILGDVAAGKEQTFGTLFARTLAQIGGKLHYGHPDFLNAIFMTTRGGISKSQRGLHLNEDIYAGMMALLRGGRITHCDYYQCGKGRDLGFGSILNFTSKIGGGMGEQMLSREYYYLGTRLPLDRFLSFYYAHPGFHLNNRFIMLSLQLFMLVLMNLGALAHESIVCRWDKNMAITAEPQPLGCYNLVPLYHWISRFVISIFICFFISFCPLVVHELTERGAKKAITRLMSHFMSLSPLFEVFVCQIYSNSLQSVLVFGGARYMATGRGFAISRIPFCSLYSNYAPSSIFTGIRLCLVLLFATVCLWQYSIMWFWITVVSLCFSPFFFNPHQFVWNEFFLDYREFLRWLTRGNSQWHASSWIQHTRLSRSRYTGFKRGKLRGDDGQIQPSQDRRRAPFANILVAEVLAPLGQSIFMFTAYTFINAQNGVKEPEVVNSVVRMAILVIVPILINILVLLLIFLVSCLLGPLLSYCCNRTGTVSSFVAHGIAVLVHAISFELTWVLEGWDFSRALCAFICCVCIQQLLFRSVVVLLLTRELKQDSVNRAWWSGNWAKAGIGIFVISQPFRELLVKTIEMSLFAADFTLGHALLFCLSPILFVPWIDSLHTRLLFWMKNTGPLRGRIYSPKKTRLRRKRVRLHAMLFFTILAVFIALVLVPVIVGHTKFVDYDLPDRGLGLIQPHRQNNNDTGSQFVVKD